MPCAMNAIPARMRIGNGPYNSIFEYSFRYY
jgi:hypothetical protein